MRVLALLVFLTLTLAGDGWANGFDHTTLDRVLKGYVNEIGEVDYDGLKKNPDELDRYVEMLAATSPANRPQLFPTRDDRLAYWLNAYNAFVLKAVSAAYPVNSVRDMGFLYSFFWRRKFLAGGQQMTLTHLENQMIRRRFSDPRIHFALVCASLSCPLLPREAFTGPALQEQLERAARLFINQKRNLTMDTTANRVYLSGLYNLSDYEEDFLQHLRRRNPDRKVTLLDYILLYLTPRVTLLDYILPYLTPRNFQALNSLRNPRVEFFRYDWSINDPGSRARAGAVQERELARGSPRRRR